MISKINQLLSCSNKKRNYNQNFFISFKQKYAFGQDHSNRDQKF